MTQWDAIDRFDLAAYLERFSARRLQTDEWLIWCPNCGKNKLTVNTQRRTWHCWVCEEFAIDYTTGQRRAVRGAGGLLGLISMLEGIGREQAAELVRSQAGLLGEAAWMRSDAPLDQSLQSFDLPVLPIIPPPTGATPICGILPYLQKRGIMEEDVRAFGLFWCSSGRYANRVLFPVYEGSRMVYYQARAMWEPAPGERFQKALNPPATAGMATSGEVLMNLDVARNFPRVAIVEGPIDCIHSGPSAVATFGKKITLVQMLKLRQAGVRAVDLMWDGPSENEPMGAWPEMVQVAPKLAGLFDVRVVRLPQGDPGEYSRNELEAFRRMAQPIGQVSRLGTL